MAAVSTSQALSLHSALQRHAACSKISVSRRVSSTSGRVLGSVSPNASRVARLVIEASADRNVLEASKAASQEGVKGLWAAAVAAASAFAIANPALAEAVGEVVEAVVEAEEKGKIFDFNLTLPIIAIQFLLLMVALDKIWYTPVGAVMDARDADIRSKLEGVRDNSAQIKQMQDEAEAIIKVARAETSLAMNKMKKETAAQLDEKLQKSRERIEKELATALSNLERQKEETLKGLESQVKRLSDEIVSKVIPFKI
eukprot:TRINITY_DN20150_c0_g1_i1.p1 TRINITY_DN20150_c0_g1~~TRINITY_DN20150_c0_g1_i1.p1  ORF type:complete len:256 (-),score=86.00 TRINITY_DN20150_c0_g1_i1:803-1570(-)